MKVEHDYNYWWCAYCDEEVYNVGEDDCPQCRKPIGLQTKDYALRKTIVNLKKDIALVLNFNRFVANFLKDSKPPKKYAFRKNYRKRNRFYGTLAYTKMSC